MRQIQLWVNGKGYQPFEYEEIDDLADELSDRGITIGYDVSIGFGVSIGKGASIEDYARIGEGASIGKGTSIEDYAIIGKGTSIEDYAIIGKGTSIEDYAIIGKGTSIEDYAIIGKGTSIGNGASIVKTISLTGTRDYVNWYGTGVIHIGCIIKTISEWQEQYEKVGKEHGYSEEQISEYKGYIDMCAGLQDSIEEDEPAE